ncbi:cytochrome c biogenesis CcdA family protein [Frondihabitans australicus]|uniref:Cytochrome c biogenesis protein CcdA n=1 Tax=Frondihabitans australicus TaxID=386892 RepID=A0A495IH72_9MICO|nr:cytochrome c biogenesis protein CcdA [Frondihabitans australicus]RKR74426.1 cytochrome c biogenesis protein CcdA [Frondihabitans australicus]
MIGYAFTLGLVAAVNPCGFPLLPAYLSLFVSAPEGRGAAGRMSRGVIAGSCLTLGFLAVFVVAGLLLEAGAGVAASATPWLMVAVGVACVALGVLGLTGRGVHLALPAPGLRAGRGGLAMTGFGVAYAVGSLNCSLPLFVAGVLDPVASSDAVVGIAAFLAYALGMGVFVTGAGVVASLVGAERLRRLGPVLRIMPAVSSAILIAAGLYLALYWASDAVGRTAGPVITTALDAQSAVSAWLAAHSLTVGFVCGGLVLVGFAVVAIAASREAARLEAGARAAIHSEPQEGISTADV